MGTKEKDWNRINLIVETWPSYIAGFRSDRSKGDWEEISFLYQEICNFSNKDLSDYAEFSGYLRNKYPCLSGRSINRLVDTFCYYTYK
ncbi:MAG: hypothetical protein LBV43_06725 [Prevotella sp.]|jgi:hypothetical protein|nr:hypothetical protein [Prevotella sp.]